MTAKSIRVTGKVQGVNFRYFTTQEARKLGLTGTVENLADGSVSVIAEGEIGALELLIRWCRKGPLMARVEEVEVAEVPVVGHNSFVILR
jgi:acylphosphatase